VFGESGKYYLDTLQDFSLTTREQDTDVAVGAVLGIEPRIMKIRQNSM
jgi:hypothetical protein